MTQTVTHQDYLAQEFPNDTVGPLILSDPFRDHIDETIEHLQPIYSVLRVCNKKNTSAISEIFMKYRAIEGHLQKARSNDKNLAIYSKVE